MSIALVTLTLSTWTLARLVGRYDIHWLALLLCWTLIGAVVGQVLANLRGLLIGAASGLVVGTVLIFYDVFLWITFTLPPFPKYDF